METKISSQLYVGDEIKLLVTEVTAPIINIPNLSPTLRCHRNHFSVKLFATIIEVNLACVKILKTSTRQLSSTKYATVNLKHLETENMSHLMTWTGTRRY